MISFAYEAVPVSDVQFAAIKALRERFTEMESFIKATSLSGRYQSIALTQLEQAAMWAVKSLTHSPLKANQSDISLKS